MRLSLTRTRTRGSWPRTCARWLGQDTNTHAGAAGGITNNQQKFKSMTFEEAMKPWPGGGDTNSQPKFTSVPVAELSDTPPGGGETNSQEKFIPPPANSFSFQDTKARAEKGDADAQSCLGWCYASGHLPLQAADTLAHRCREKAIENLKDGAPIEIKNQFDKALFRKVERNAALLRRRRLKRGY